MNHTTQEPKSMQLAVELEYRKEYEAAHELRAQQARIADLEAQLHAIGAGGVGASIQPQAQPDTAQIPDVRIRTSAPDTPRPPAAHQEPVAWRVHPFDCGIGSKGAFALTMRPEQVEMWKRKGLRVEPLYAAPQPDRKPLTDEQIIEWVKSGEYNVTTNDWASHIEFTRAIEQAHGITGGRP